MLLLKKESADMFKCPVCGGEIGFFRKCFQSVWNKSIIECPSCGRKLRLKPYGTSRSDTTLIVIFTYFFLDIKDWIIPVCILEFLIFSLIKRIFLPLVPYDPKQKISFGEALVLIISGIGIVVGLLIEFF